MGVKIEERRDLFHWEKSYLDQQGERRGARQRRRRTRAYVEGAYNEDRIDPREEEVSRMEASRPLDIRDFEGNKDENEIRRAVKKWLRRETAARIVEKWQRSWSNATLGRWTFRLVLYIKTWTSRRHDELHLYTTQALTGHRVFNIFRKRIGKRENDSCWCHQGAPDTKEHTPLNCQRWEAERLDLRDALELREEEMTMEKIVERILASKATWEAFEKYCKRSLKEKEKEQSRREEDGADTPIV